MQRRALGEKHPIVATTLNSLAHVLVSTGRLDEAASVRQQALGIAKAGFGKDHQLLAIYMINSASVELARNKPALAEPLVREGLRIRSLAPNLVPSRRRTFLEDDWSVGATKSLLGGALVALKQYDEAETVLLDARRDLEASSTPRPSEIKATITRLVELYAAWGKPEMAASYRVLLAS
jgi:eukaryotic-like serine/threonine-protein kinase